MEKVLLHKNETMLPYWLDHLIFNKLNAIYQPDFNKFKFNLELNEEDVKNYLGTYFPKSYGEMFCIGDTIFQNKNIIHHFDKKTIKIFDLCSGTGGELIGLLCAINKYLPNLENIYICVYEGNQYAIDELKKILEAFTKVYCDIKLTFEHKNTIIKNAQDLNLIHFDTNFDFILCNKTCCEFYLKKVMKQPYYEVVKALAPHLSSDGLLVILDITTKAESDKLFYPAIMNKELNQFITEHSDYATLLPLTCSGKENICQYRCFIKQTYIINHSRHQNDISRIYYRVLCHKTFRDQIIPIYNHNQTRFVIALEDIDNNKFKLCPCDVELNTDKTYIDAFALK